MMIDYYDVKWKRWKVTDILKNKSLSVKKNHLPEEQKFTWFLTRISLSVSFQNGNPQDPGEWGFVDRLYLTDEGYYIYTVIQPGDIWNSATGSISNPILPASWDEIDGRWMLIAQHLLAWAVLFYPEKAEDLPSLELLFDRLILLEKSI